MIKLNTLNTAKSQKAQYEAQDILSHYVAIIFFDITQRIEERVLNCRERPPYTTLDSRERNKSSSLLDEEENCPEGVYPKK